MGKGSTRRPTNDGAYAGNYDRIFGSKEAPEEEDVDDGAYAEDEDNESTD